MCLCFDETSVFLPRVPRDMRSDKKKGCRSYTPLFPFGDQKTETNSRPAKVAGEHLIMNRWGEKGQRAKKRRGGGLSLVGYVGGGARGQRTVMDRHRPRRHRLGRGGGQRRMSIT